MVSLATPGLVVEECCAGGSSFAVIGVNIPGVGHFIATLSVTKNLACGGFATAFRSQCVFHGSLASRQRGLTVVGGHLTLPDGNFARGNGVIVWPLRVTAHAP